MESRRILLVEDDRFLSDLYKTELEKAGFQVNQSYDGFEALAKIGSEKYDLVILDMVIPELTGIEIIQKLSAAGKLSSLHLVVLTNLKDDKITQEALKLGAKGYLVKTTVTPDQLSEEIKRFLPLNS